MTEKIKPKCPACGAVDNMAGSNEGPIFCAICGAYFANAMALWVQMRRQMNSRLARNLKKKAKA